MRKNCPYCGETMDRNPNDPTVHCGAPACRQKEYRKNQRVKLETARAETQARVARYMPRLNAKQQIALQHMSDVLMGEEPSDRESGHTQVEAMLDLIADLQCKHHKISYLTSYAETLLRRAQRAEAQAKAQAALDEQRIEELEQEILLYQYIEQHIHGLAEQQLAIQPDQEPSEEPAPLKEAANLR